MQIRFNQWHYSSCAHHLLSCSIISCSTVSAMKGCARPSGWICLLHSKGAAATKSHRGRISLCYDEKSIHLIPGWWNILHLVMQLRLSKELGGTCSHSTDTRDGLVLNLSMSSPSPLSGDWIPSYLSWTMLGCLYYPNVSSHNHIF